MTMRGKYIRSELIFWGLILILIVASAFLIVFGDEENLKRIFYKSTELGSAILSISTGAATTRIFMHFSGDNLLKKQKSIRFRLLSNIFINLNRLQSKGNTSEWEKAKGLCVECINDFYLNACEENVEEFDVFIKDFSEKFLDEKYEKSIGHITRLINDIQVRIDGMDNKNKSIYSNRLKRIKKLK